MEKAVDIADVRNGFETVSVFFTKQKCAQGSTATQLDVSGTSPRIAALTQRQNFGRTPVEDERPKGKRLLCLARVLNDVP